MFSWEKINSKSAKEWFNKGNAPDKLGGYENTIKYFENASISPYLFIANSNIIYIPIYWENL